MAAVKTFFRRSWRAFDYLLGALVVIASGLLSFILLAVAWDVIVRRVAGAPLPWVLEVTEYSLLYITFLCTAWVLKHEGHVNSDLLLIALSRSKRAFLNFVTSITGAIVCLLLTYFGLTVSMEKLESGSFQPTAMGIPDFPLFLIIPIGFFLLLIQFLRRAYRHFSEWKEVNTSNH